MTLPHIVASCLSYSSFGLVVRPADLRIFRRDDPQLAATVAYRVILFADRVGSDSLLWSNSGSQILAKLDSMFRIMPVEVQKK
jgi:hypothetical protein